MAWMVSLITTAPKPPKDGVDAGEQGEPQDGHPQRYDGEQRLKDEPARVQRRGHVDEHHGEEVEGGEGQARALVVALAQELGHREGPASQVERQDKEDEDHEYDGGHPLVGVDRDALAVTGPREANEGGPAHVSREEGEADQGPYKVPPAEKVVVRVLLLAAEQERDDPAEHQIRY
jgi:hypothetical protein